MSSTAYRWLRWQPGQIITDTPRDEPTKPTKPPQADQKPGSVGFDGALQGQSHIILSHSEAAAADLEARFGQPHARLFPLLGRRVSTPAGTGTLLQVFAQRCAVDCGRKTANGEPQVEFFAPEQIEAIQ